MFISRRSFVVLTTSKSGLQLGKGLACAGHMIVACGVGYSDTKQPIGALDLKTARSVLRSAKNFCLIPLEASNAPREFFSSYLFDLAIVSWPHILDRSAIASAGERIIGSHPSPLPLGRGRHPLHWQRVLGIFRSSSTLFWINAGIDSGRTVLSLPFFLKPSGDITDDLKALEQTQFVLGFLLGIRLWFGVPKGRKQELTKGTILKKRSSPDTHIDFRMTPKAIVQHVRSIVRPWPMATMTDKNGELRRIAAARYAPLALFRRRNRWSPFGAVLKISSNKTGLNEFLIRCYEGAVWLMVE